MKCLFSKDRFHCFFSKEGNKPDRSKLEKAKKRTHEKMQKISEVFWVFQTLLNDLYQIIVGIPKFLDTGRKSWTLDAGLWSLDSGRWTLDCGCWTLDSRLWMLDSELWILDSGHWNLHLGS